VNGEDVRRFLRIPNAFFCGDLPAGVDSLVLREPDLRGPEIGRFPETGESLLPRVTGVAANRLGLCNGSDLTAFFRSLEADASVRTKSDFLVELMLHLADGDWYGPSIFFTRFEGVSSKEGSIFSESASNVDRGE
jgi:hypothetical protein